MRILQVTNGYPPRAFGGVETHTQRLVTALRTRGHDLRIFTRHSEGEGQDGTLVHEEVDGVGVTSIVNDARGGRFRDHFLSAPVADAFRAEITRHRPDRVHFQHLIGLSADLPTIAHDAGIRCVATIHEYWYACQRVMLQKADLTACTGPANEDCVACFLGEAASREEQAEAAARSAPSLLKRLRGRGPKPSPALVAGPPVAAERFACLQAALRSYARITTPSQFVIDEMARQGMPLAADRTRAIALGLPEAARPATPPRTSPISAAAPLRLVYIGHLLPHKGPHTILEAMRLVPELPLRLDLYGRRWPENPYEKTLFPLLAAEGRAHAHGRFADGDLPDILAAADLLVVPSTCPESFGLATREAFLAGRPVLSTDRGALPESVGDGEDGILVPAEDAPAMATALRRVVEQKALLGRLSAGAAATRIRTMDDYAAELEAFLYA
ncbi:MAG: glycosyltransferase [Deltaproteobacteria bacterium]